MFWPHFNSWTFKSSRVGNTELHDQTTKERLWLSTTRNTKKSHNFSFKRNRASILMWFSNPSLIWTISYSSKYSETYFDRHYWKFVRNEYQFHESPNFWTVHFSKEINTGGNITQRQLHFQLMFLHSCNHWKLMSTTT